LSEVCDWCGANDATFSQLLSIIEATFRTFLQLDQNFVPTSWIECAHHTNRKIWIKIPKIRYLCWFLVRIVDYKV